MTLNQRIQDLSNISSALGLLMKSPNPPESFIPIKLIFEPYLIKKEHYVEIGQISKVWQKLLYLASKDTELIKKTFEQVSQVDEMMNNLYRIFLKSSTNPTNDSLFISRVDYFKSSDDQFKIIQYNVTATSMHTHSQNYQKAQQMIQFKEESNSNLQYPNNIPCSDMVDAITQLYKQKHLNGIFLMIVAKRQKNIIDQTNIQLKLMQRGIKSKRQCLCNLYGKIQKRSNKIFYNNLQISMVYYRAGYQPKDYCESGQFQKCWEVREIIQLSDAIKIPDVRIELMNQKRMQVELSKSKVHEKYLTEEECRHLRKSLVFTWDFQENSEKTDIVKYIEEKGTDKFILKPNLQGGGNNIYGQKAYELLKKLSEEERRKYILMEKIITIPLLKTSMMGTEYKTEKCISQISRYGILMEIDGKLVRNDCDGYLVRVKPQSSDEGGVMAGVGSISTIALENNS